MSKSFSIYLDFIRFSAALGVLFGHVATQLMSGGLIWHLGRYSSICVTIFFVLSGYVIAYVTDTREKSCLFYFISRFSRLYSVTVLALILTYIFDKYGILFNPELYSTGTLHMDQRVIDYLTALFFISEYQSFGFDGISPGTNVPFWSLSFEFTYYVLVGLFIFVRRLLAILVAILILGFAGKTISALMPIWLLGYFLYKVRSNIFTVPSWYAVFAAVLSALIIILMPKLSSLLPTDNFGYQFPWGYKQLNRNLVQDYLTAIAFASHLLVARQLLENVKIGQSMESFIRWLGLLTFPLYCIHYPAMCFFRAISPFEPTTWSNLIFILISVLLVITIITPVCEYLKLQLRKTLSSVIKLSGHQK